MRPEERELRAIRSLRRVTPRSQGGSPVRLAIPPVDQHQSNRCGRRELAWLLRADELSANGLDDAGDATSEKQIPPDESDARRRHSADGAEWASDRGVACATGGVGEWPFPFMWPFPWPWPFP